MSLTPLRLSALAAQQHQLAPWLGGFDSDSLHQLLKTQLGSVTILDQWERRGDTRCRAFPLSPLLHIVSGNTPHAAFQSIVRGLIIGAHNRVKLPSEGIPEFENWVAQLPSELSSLIEIQHHLPDSWLQSAGAVIFGSQKTLDHFRQALPAGVPRIEHGPKLSIAVMFEPTADVLDALASDILTHEQRGCLSVQAVYVAGGIQSTRQFAAALAIALSRYREQHPAPPRDLSDSGAISNARELIRFRQANGDFVELHESQGSTAWTVVMDTDPLLAPGPLNGFITVHPLPDFENLTDALGSERQYLSTLVLYPCEDSYADRLSPLKPPRICPPGKAQHPPFFWHHDGRPPLADLITWRERHD